MVSDSSNHVSCFSKIGHMIEHLAGHFVSGFWKGRNYKDSIEFTTIGFMY